MKTVRLVIIASLATLFVLPGVASAQVEVTPLEKTVAQVQPSIVFLDITWTGWVYDKYNDSYLNTGQRAFVLPSYCTGFVVDPGGYIATAGHCVDERAVTEDFMDLAAQWALSHHYYADRSLTFADVRGFAEDDYRIEGAGDTTGGADTASGAEPKGADLDVQVVWSTSSTEPLYDKYGDLNGTPYGARLEGLIPWNDGAGDTAILKIDAPAPMTALPLAVTDDISTGTDIVSVGYPASVGDVSDATLANPSFKTGAISSIRTTGLYPVYETDASLSGGMSGGPTVNLQGEVVGINSFGIVGETDTFEFIQSIETLDDLLGQEGIDAEVGEPGTSYRAGLEAYWAGDKNEAVQNLTAATEASSDTEMAAEFLNKAEALPAPVEPASGGSSIPLIAGVLLGVIALAGGLFLLQRRRKSKEPTPTPAMPMAPPASASSEEPTAPLPTPAQATAQPAVKVPTVELGARSPANGNLPPGGWYCPKDGHPNAADANFCWQCRTPRPLDAAPAPAETAAEKYRRETRKGSV